MQAEELYPYYLAHATVSTDSRAIMPNSIFFALKGANFNGNAYAAESLKQGAAYAVVDEERFVEGERFLLVDDVLTALQDLAKLHRSKLNIPVIGITGTNGKTTTKELLHAVLAEKYETFATKGNLNNHIGVPLSILSIHGSAEIAIIEMGANHQHEIAFLCAISQPTHGLITNVGKAHLEGFGGFEGVIKTKGELYDYLAENNGTLFLQGDNTYLTEMAAQRNLPDAHTYGFSEKNQVIGRLVQANPHLEIEWHTKGKKEMGNIQTQLTGVYNAENILAAISVGNHFEVTPEQIKRGISAYHPTNNRSQITKTDKNTVICDYYNANASSMVAALENLKQLASPKKVTILGDMFELGDESFGEHLKLVTLADSLPVERRIYVGKEFIKHRNERDEFYETTQDAAEALGTNPVSGAMVLLKASRSMAFEKLVELL